MKDWNKEIKSFLPQFEAWLFENPKIGNGKMQIFRTNIEIAWSYWKNLRISSSREIKRLLKLKEREQKTYIARAALLNIGGIRNGIYFMNGAIDLLDQKRLPRKDEFSLVIGKLLKKNFRRGKYTSEEDDDYSYFMDDRRGDVLRIEIESKCRLEKT